MGPRCPGCGAYGDIPGLCDECQIKVNSRPERVRWYCHTCGRTHTHTPDERDAHRDQIRADEVAARTPPSADSGASS